MIKQTKDNLKNFEKIRHTVEGFHHHVSILRDISDSIEKDSIVYVEIGCFAGATAALMLEDERVNVISIDIGFPKTQEVVMDNITAIRGSTKRYSYIKGDSKKEKTINYLSNILGERKIDILFIDGDHTAQAVKEDFYNYSPFVTKGGYVVFDDYLDFQYSPEVYPAVNELVQSLEGYESIGTLDNIHNAIPGKDKEQRFEKLNEYILKKNV